MFKVSNEDIFIVNFEHNTHLVLVFLLLTLDMKLPVKLQTTLLTSHNALKARHHFLTRKLTFFIKCALMQIRKSTINFVYT